MSVLKRVAASSPEAKARMQRTRQKNTSAETLLRRSLHALGLRYRLHVVVSTKPRRIADIVFGSRRTAVFVDGCFWHGCPLHASWPKKNAEFWRSKIEANRARDAQTSRLLRADGWEVIRLWEHEVSHEAAVRVAQIVAARPSRSHPLTQTPARRQPRAE